MDYMAYQNNMINIDANKLASIGFTQQEIQQLCYVYSNGGKFTTNALQSYGYNYEQAKKLSYMYNICAGKINIDSKEELIKHLRRMFGSNYRIGIQDLAVSRVNSVPRVAIVSNIIDEPYSIWNSNRYRGKEALYKVVDVSGQKITIETPRKPILKYGSAKEIKGVLEIKGVKQNGNAVITFDKKYCKLCNRFIIVASLRNPEFHLGKYEIICFEGTKVYIYASNMGVKDNVKYSMGTQRVYDYGIFPQEIKAKLDNVTKVMYKHLNGVKAELYGANTDYKVIEPEKTDSVDDSITV